jgi:hypothetical protein
MLTAYPSCASEIAADNPPSPAPMTMICFFIAVVAGRSRLNKIAFV